MSDLLNTSDDQQHCHEQPCDGIDFTITPRGHDLGGFQVRRVLPFRQKRSVGPWVFFDHMGPADFSPGPGINVRPHPHIGLATVTYLFDGEIFHRDSLGNAQAIVPGDINLMIAGKGITHSERESLERQKIKRKAHGLQLWLALPESHEVMDPEFHHYDASDIPITDVDGVAVRVMMGTAYSATSPVMTLSETLYMEAKLKSGQKLLLPDAEERAVYVVEGALNFRDTPIKQHEMAILKPHSGIEVTALIETHLALVGGAPLGERFIEWNFVSSQKERIHQAKQDWVNGKFPKVPEDDEEFIPLPG